MKMKNISQLVFIFFFFSVISIFLHISGGDPFESRFLAYGSEGIWLGYESVSLFVAGLSFSICRFLIARLPDFRMDITI
jgi:hypothetical protein